MKYVFLVPFALTTAGCLLPSLDGMSGGRTSSTLDAGPDAPPPEALPPEGPALRVDDATSGVTRTWVDGEFGIDFSRATGWQPNGFYDAASGTELRDMSEAWLEVVTMSPCLTTTGWCGPSSDIDKAVTPPPTRTLVHDGVRATLASSYARPSFGSDVRVSFAVTVFVNGRTHVHVHAGADPTISVSPDLEYGNLRLRTPSTTWHPFAVAPAIALEDSSAQRAIVGVPKGAGYGQSTNLDTTEGTTGFREAKRDLRSGLDREYDLFVLGSKAAQTAALTMATRKYAVEGDAHQTGASPESTLGFYDLTANPNAKRIVLHMSAKAPAIRILGWVSNEYTVRVDGKIVATSLRPSTTLAVASHDPTGKALEIALRVPLEPSQLVEVTSDEPMR